MSVIDREASCPACGGAELEVFHHEGSVPVHSCLLLDTESEAREFPRGELRLGLCWRCGFITNTAFDLSLTDYSSRYEETQGFSARFQNYASDLAKRWIADYDLTGRTVLEIGCGKGEFLAQMVEHGAGRGIGIDPTVAPERVTSTRADRLTWVPDLFSERYFELAPDAIVCRHTLEHIPAVKSFLDLVRASIGTRSDVVVLFELPDTLRILQETAFWDVYYEHCSYFTIGSLTGLFERCGFDVIAVHLEYDDQYIVLEARPAALEAGADAGSRTGPPSDLAAITQGARSFERTYADTIGGWRSRLESLAARDRRAVIWGGSSKAVAFLNGVGDSGNIELVVDINPFKHDKYLAGSGRRVVAPESLRDYRPEIVIVMNPIYRDEIQGSLDDMGVDAELWPV